ncbi:MAG: hypothetical protein K4571_17895 [Deltaproteobacteria bacterium]
MKKLRNANLKMVFTALFLAMGLFFAADAPCSENSPGHCRDKEISCSSNCTHGKDLGSIYVGMCYHVLCRLCDDSAAGRARWVQECHEKYDPSGNHKGLSACEQRSTWSQRYDCYDKEGKWCGGY